MAAHRISTLSTLTSLRYLRSVGLFNHWQHANVIQTLLTHSVPIHLHSNSTCQRLRVCFYSVAANHKTSSMSSGVVSEILRKIRKTDNSELHEHKQIVDEPSPVKQSPEIMVKTEEIPEEIQVKPPIVSSDSGSDGYGSEQQQQQPEKQEKKKPFISRTQKIVFTIVILSSSCYLYVNAMGSPLTDADGNTIQDEFSDYPVPLSYLARTYHETFRQVKITKEPSRQRLLPDPLEFPYMQPKYTLVMEMKDVFVHPEWGFYTGWRFKKRPGISHFLRAVGPPMFEVVVFTQLQGFTADPIITKIDPENFIMYRLYRDATLFTEGEHVKDLNYLNRDLSKVIMIDWEKRAYRTNTENGFCVKPWQGDDDTVLGELAEFLQAIAASGVEDVRPVLQYYSQFDNPLAQFRENQMKLKEEREKQAKLLESQNKLVTKTHGIGGFWR